MYSYDIRIPKNRVAVLIGVKGETKKQIQKETKTIVDIDSKEGLVTVSGEDAIQLMTARDLIKAIARGFNPDIAKLLLKPDYTFEVIDLKLVARNDKDMERLKGRIIGMQGKSRNTIEELSNTYLSVFGKTVSIIGEIENASACKRAINMIIQGSPHSSVYRMLENYRRKMRQQELGINHSF